MLQYHQQLMLVWVLLKSLAASSITGSGPFYFSLHTGSAPVYPAGTWLPEDGPNSKKAVLII
jgi:hypothetical protein